MEAAASQGTGKNITKA
jgi:hypothetical protein